MRVVHGLVLYGRPGCHLCDEMADEIADTLAPGSYRLCVEDVDTRPDWRDAYGVRVPVLTLDNGAEICATRLDVDALRAALKTR